MRRFLRCVLILPCILVLSNLTFAQAAAHAFLWTAQGGMQDLGTLPGWQGSYALSIDPLGQVVGYDILSSGEASTAFGWTPNLGMQFLRGLSLTQSQAVGLNDSGQVAATGLNLDGQLHAFIWTEQEGPVDLGDLGGRVSSAAAINSVGEIVGYSETGMNVDHAFRWTKALGMQDLMVLAGKNCPTCQSQAFAVNSSGAIAGFLGAGGLAYRWAIVYSNGKIRNLGDLGGSGKNRGSLAFGIDKTGQVVGSAYTPSGFVHAFCWTESTGMQGLARSPEAILVRLMQSTMRGRSSVTRRRRGGSCGRLCGPCLPACRTSEPCQAVRMQ